MFAFLLSVPLQEVQPPQSVEEIILWVIGLVVGFLGMGITQFVKNKFNWSDNIALLAAGAVAAVLGALQLLVTDQLNFGPGFTVETFLSVFSAIFASATVYYKALIAHRE